MRGWSTFICLILLTCAHVLFAQAPSSTPSSAQGASIFAQQCAVCHGAQGKGGIGPSLQAAHDGQQVIDIVRTGKGIMPAFGKQLTPQQIQAVAAFVTQKLAVVSLTGGNLSEGGVLFRVNCAPCHRTDVRGGALVFAKGNAPALTGLSSATIAGAIRTGPGPMPSFPPSVFDDKQLASIVAYVRFMQHPPSPGGLPLNYYGPVAEGLVAVIAVIVLAIIGVWIERKHRRPSATGGLETEHPPSQAVGMFLVVSALALAFAGEIGFLYVYWTTHNNMALGGTIAVAFGGIGVGIVIWAHRLMRHDEITGPREPLPSSSAAREAFLEDFVAGERRIGRRRVLGWMTAIVTGALGVTLISLLRSMFGKSPTDILLQPAWRRGERLVTSEGKPVAVDTLQPGSTITVFPEGRIGSVASQTLLIRVQEDLLQLPAPRKDWTPKGNVAYSRTCTHAGCPVALYEASEHILLCPCHQSTFNVLDGAQPTSGPAARPLPQLPLYVDTDGNLRAGGDFTQPPGPGFWRMPA